MGDRRGIAVRRDAVDEFDTQHIARLQAQGRSGDRAFISSHVEPVAANILVRVLHAQCGVELAIR